jgi:hypothetical protein
MPLNPDLAEAAVRSGLSAVCATCVRYWEGRDRGLPEPRCTAKTKCGSPLAGDDFHEYSGPIVEFDRQCFVCAGQSRYGITVRGRSRVIGVCLTHAKLLSDLHPVDVVRPEVVLRSASGAVLTPDQLQPKPGRTLSAAIAEVERYYDAKAKQ